MKDNFSIDSDKYAKYRPTYPPDFYAYLNSIVPYKQTAWDCGTGNGQVAFELAKSFEKVYATDISQSQIANALQSDNICYTVQPAECTNFSNQMFNLVVVAQAIHWFDFEKFYKEVSRTVKENAVLCVIGYGKLEIDEKIDSIIEDIYSNTLGNYWDKERKYIDENYQTIPFPFSEIKAPAFVNIQEWTLLHLIGYLNTWSAVKHFIKQNGYNPVDQFISAMEEIWGKSETKQVRFPLLLRIGQIV